MLVMCGFAGFARAIADEMPGMAMDPQMIEPTTPTSFTQQYALLNANGWTATASDQQSSLPASAAIDGNTATLWHSQYSPLINLPHSLTIDMKTMTTIGGLAYTPRQDTSNNGNIGRFTIATSADGVTWSA